MMDEEGSGYGKPPRSGRFTKGRSGNPAGRPKGRHREPPHEAVLGQILTIRDGGVPRQVSAEEAFGLRMLKLALEGNSAATRAVETLKEDLDLLRDREGIQSLEFVIHFVAPGSVNTALEHLKMGRILDRYREETARVVLEPWLVEAALDRLGERRLSRAEQETVVSATRTPKKVSWPGWWEVLPK